MLVSKEQLEDIAWRKTLIDTMEDYLNYYDKTGQEFYLEAAKELGVLSKEMKEVIATTGYSERDRMRVKIDHLMSCG